MGIICQQPILMEYHALFVIFEKAAKFRLLHIVRSSLPLKLCWTLQPFKNYTRFAPKTLFSKLRTIIWTFYHFFIVMN